MSLDYAKANDREDANYMSLNNNKNLKILRTSLKNAQKHSVRIFEFGDSHTAADFFSGYLRQYLQKRFGDGGVGFITPLGFRGARYSRIFITKPNLTWKVATSRRGNFDDFPLGGHVATSYNHKNIIELIPVIPEKDPQTLRLLYKSQKDNNIYLQHDKEKVKFFLKKTSNWMFSYPINITFPISILLQNMNSNIDFGGWNIEGPHKGIVFSSLGSNGASVYLLDRWKEGWQKQLKDLHPNVIILSYGTNESFNNKFDSLNYEKTLKSRIDNFKKNFSSMVIILMGPGDSIYNKNYLTCKKHSRLDDVISIQKKIAAKEHILFWDWRRYMGGKCSIRQWMQRKDAQPDYVHLTPAGYEKTAGQFYRDLLKSVNLDP